MSGSAVVLNRSSKFHFDNLFWDNPQPYEDLILYQIGDLYCNGGYEVGEHIQECYEISYIVSGKGKYFTNGKAYQLKKGDIYLCLPYQRHNYIADCVDPFRFFYIGFDFDNCTKKPNDFYHIQKMFNHMKHPVVEDKYGIYQSFTGVFRELVNGKKYSLTMVKTYLNQIIILTYRNFFDKWQDEYRPEKTFNNNDAQITYQIINYIDTNLFSVQVLSEISDELGYSYSYLSHIFSEETGLTIQQYFNQKKFEKAIDLLKKGELTVTEIAEELNYKSIHSFSKAFKKNIGVSPMQYQQIYRSKISANR